MIPPFFHFSLSFKIIILGEESALTTHHVDQTALQIKETSGFRFLFLLERNEDKFYFHFL